RRMRATPVTLKLTESALRREDKGAKGYYMLVDVAGRATYFINTMTAWDERSQTSTVTGHMAEKFPWSDIDSLGKILLDNAMQDARMLERRDKEEGEKETAALKAMQGPATVEATEETKEVAGLTCKKYTISQGEHVKGYAWVAQDVKLKVPLGRMLAYSVNENAGGLPALVQLDELEGLPVDVSLEFPVLAGRRQGAMMSFVIDKVGEANIDAAEVKVPGRARVEEPLSERLRSRGRRD
ncbi:MAG: hypothetical protein AMJ81_12985, partial [Phycisphaerae bacterium SM23_33]